MIHRRRIFLSLCAGCTVLLSIRDLLLHSRLRIDIQTDDFLIVPQNGQNGMSSRNHTVNETSTSSLLTGSTANQKRRHHNSSLTSSKTPESSSSPPRVKQPESATLNLKHLKSNESTDSSVDSKHPSVSVAVEKFQSSITMDIVSVGSLHRLDLLQAQTALLQKHSSVRKIYPITENDDSEADCHSNLTFQQLEQVVEYCRAASNFSALEPHRQSYMTVERLKKKTNPMGWLCAQKRPMDGWYKALSDYASNTTTIPDYLWVIDDDTFLNLPLLVPELQRHYPASSSYAVTGCRYRYRDEPSRFSYSYGGYGTFWTRALIEQLLQPIDCTAEDSSWTLRVCAQLELNAVGEKEWFLNTMTLGQLMHAMVSKPRYQDVSNWNGAGYCVHSDWVWGWLSLYNFSKPDLEIQQRLHYDERIIAYHGNEVSYATQLPHARERRRQCYRHGKTCSIEHHICHYMTPQILKRLERKMLNLTHE